MAQGRPTRWRTSTRILVWTAILSVSAVSNALVEVMDAGRRGADLRLWEPLIWEFSSLSLILATLPLLWWGCERWPLHADTWRRRLPLYLLASVGWSLLHVVGMMLVRHLAYAAVGYRYQDDAGWLERFAYEYLKDVRTFALFVALEHLASWLGRRRQGEASLLAEPDVGVPVEPVERPQHFLVRKLGKEFLVATEDVEYAQAAGNYVNLHVRGHDYPLRITMSVLEQRLDPGVFLRPHRSWMINRGQLRSIEPLEGGEALLHMADGVKVPCSRRQLPQLRLALAGG
ncbi:TPA: LytTR family transcriptional regulator DNA-binding domain-containing protein [Stenotrophomonas maltophilia]|uniref:LytTR family DNA-binding domain-containing protein n=1 Tax=Stenotrophomonas maltophilia TaxID=40324 RepID=A0AAJ2JAQ1_STEMA|nr:MULTISPECIES: LytTR family DNA-binding domain-containing protein [Stenotrophomonas]MDQ7281889.1 LytTR family DNA-binding domain-containing protein [Stenotrophomonas sp. Sm6012]MDT3468528.1 LytTR family DNA-binding domain-containing protein [Stenotrophomonas maltophilia]HEL3181714.1 LytTR family transcriptional regulator DNA-binding domain-containing protein [Stenotrophomonas maltophilia]